MTADLHRRALRESLILEQDHARMKVWRGVALAMISPVIALLTLFVLLATIANATVPLLVAAAVVLGGVGFGGASILVGMGQLRESKRQVRELDEPIPRARLVE
jgi:hypothetical protein